MQLAFDYVIVVNGSNFRVTKSLHDAIKRARIFGVTALWADQICVNQDDEVKRGLQVRMMGRIYEKAKRVFVSLIEWKTRMMPRLSNA